MIKFNFEGPEGTWNFAIRNHDSGTDSSVWLASAAHLPFKDNLPTNLKGYGIYEGYFEIEGSATPSTLTLVAAACRVVEDEINQT